MQKSEQELFEIPILKLKISFHNPSEVVYFKNNIEKFRQMNAKNVFYPHIGLSENVKEDLVFGKENTYFRQYSSKICPTCGRGQFSPQKWKKITKEDQIKYSSKEIDSLDCTLCWYEKEDERLGF